MQKQTFPEPSGLFAVSSTCSATDIHLAGQCWSNVKHYLPLMAVHYFVTTSTLTIYSHFYHSVCVLNILLIKIKMCAKNPNLRSTFEMSNSTVASERPFCTEKSGQKNSTLALFLIIFIVFTILLTTDYIRSLVDYKPTSKGLCHL